VKKASAIEYTPAPTDRLSDKQKKSIYFFINGKTQYLAFSPVLGWTIKKNGKSGKYQANSQGIRADREYSLVPQEGIVRISSFGDSYTHCDDVKNKNTWQAQMETASQELEVLNFGVPAYGLDQAFLRYHREGAQYNSHIVLIGFMPENINRHVNVFRPFYVPSPYWPFSKPRFTIKDSKLWLIKNPLYEPSRYYRLLESPESVLPEMGEHDFHFNFPTRYKQGPLDFLRSVRLAKMTGHECMKFGKRKSAIISNGSYNTDSDAYKVTAKLFDEFVELATKNGSLPIIIILPNENDVVQYRKNRTKVYAPLLDHFENKKYRYTDAIEIVDSIGAELTTDELLSTIFIRDPSVVQSFHYSPSTNKLVAEYILDYLRTSGVIGQDGFHGP
jgi:hypothetical protein